MISVLYPSPVRGMGDRGWVSDYIQWAAWSGVYSECPRGRLSENIAHTARSSFRVYMQPSPEVFVCSTLVTDLMLISVSDVHDRSLFQYQ